MNENFAIPKRKVQVGARIEPRLAEEVRTLAELGNRSVSREISAAIKEHVEAARSTER